MFRPVVGRHVIGFLTEHNNVLGKVFSAAYIGGTHIVRVMRKIKELQRTPFSDRALVRPQSVAADIKLKFPISILLCFSGKRIILQDVIMRRVFFHRLHVMYTRIMRVQANIIQAPTLLVTCVKCYERKSEKICFHVAFDAIVILF